MVSGEQRIVEVKTYSTTCVMTGEQRLECHHTVLVRLLDTAVESVVQVGSIIGVAIAIGNHAGVHTSAVAVPDLKESFRYWLTGIDINYLDVKRERNTFLIFSDVLTNKLALHPVRTLSSLGSQDAAVIAGEEDRRIRIDGDAGQVGLVVGGQNAFKIAGAEVRFLYRKCKCLFP